MLGGEPDREDARRDQQAGRDDLGHEATFARLAQRFGSRGVAVPLVGIGHGLEPRNRQLLAIVAGGADALLLVDDVAGGVELERLELDHLVGRLDLLAVDEGWGCGWFDVLDANGLVAARREHDAGQ